MREVYEQCWSMPEYRRYSPGEHVLPIFRRLARKRGTLLDIGCGTGRAGKALSDAGWDVTLLDFASNAPEVDLPFVSADVTRFKAGDGLEFERGYDYGYCCDMMEHLKPNNVHDALQNIFAVCRRVFFSIHFGPDQFGAAVGHPLHLTVQPFTWWRDKLAEYRTVKDARDMLGMGTFYCV